MRNQTKVPPEPRPRETSRHATDTCRKTQQQLTQLPLNLRLNATTFSTREVMQATHLDQQQKKTTMTTSVSMYMSMYMSMYTSIWENA